MRCQGKNVFRFYAIQAFSCLGVILDISQPSLTAMITTCNNSERGMHVERVSRVTHSIARGDLLRLAPIVKARTCL